MKTPSEVAKERMSALSAGVKTPQITRILWESCHLTGMERGHLLVEADATELDDNLQYLAVRDHYNGAAGIWRTLRGVTQYRAVLDVAVRTDLLTDNQYQQLLQEFGELPLDTEKAQEDAIQRGDLVLVRYPPAAYWKGALIPIDWNQDHASWNFFLIAAEHAQRSQPIDQWSFGEEARANIVTQQKSRLKSLKGFPPELIEAFKVENAGTQRLTIPPESIQFFDQ